MKKIRRMLGLLLVVMLVFSGCGLFSEVDQTEQPNTQVGSINTETSKDTEEIKDSESSKDTEEIKDSETSKDTENISDSESTEELDEAEITLYAQSNVNVRSKPSTEGEKLGTLSKNEKVTGLGKAVNGWQKILYKGEVAYVSAQYLAETKVEVSASTEPQKQVDEITAEDLPVPDLDPDGIIVVIDAGHQGKGNSNKEPDGPGSGTLKAKVTSGATGCVTKQQEYILNLEVSLKLRDELISRGYQVVMIRENHAINISNSERAKYANNLGADAFIRIHANSSDSSSVSGIETICQTSSNPYNASIYKECRKLSECILDEVVESTGAKKRRVWETDTMSGINWCEVPVTILEMGFLSNPEEDRLMADDDYQDKMVEGIANGLDKYFGR